MELAIQSGNAQKMTGICRLVCLAAVTAVVAFGQLGSVTCSPYAVPTTIHPEGLTERVGDVTITCSGGNAGTSVLITAFVGIQNATVTNAPDANGNLGINVTINTGSGPVPVGSAQLNGTQTVVVQGAAYTVAPGGTVATITVSGIRVAIGNTPGIAAVYANLGGVGAIFPPSNGPLALAVPAGSGSLLSTYLGSIIPCSGSPLPTVIDFPTFLGVGTSVASMRVTEGYIGAFSPRDPNLPNGTRLVVSLAGYPTGARVFVPDVLVGNTGSGPTSAGAFGSFAQSGSYIPGSGSGQLLLTRVDRADASGAGGTPVLPVSPTVPTTFTGLTEVTLVKGAAVVTYEVIEVAPAYRENVQVPVFVVAPPVPNCTVAQPTLSVKLGPISTVAVSDNTAPLPRYVSATPQSDCSVIGDCTATYFPALSLNTTSLTFNGAAYGATQILSFTASNTGQGVISYNITTTYPAGAASGWLTVTPSSGINNQTVNVAASPAALLPGTYNATITVNAGQFGTQNIQVTFAVGAPGVTIQSIVSAATFLQGGPLTPGSIASMFGLNLSGKAISVSFNGLGAQVFGVYPTSGSGGLQQQVNLLVPAGLAGQTSALVVANVDGVSSNSFPVSLVQNSPGVFNPGILNQNFSVNLPSAPAKVGSIVSAYMTGLSIPLTGQVTVKIGTTDFLIPQYAGVAPTLSGVQQINVLIPPSLSFSGNQASFQVCIPALDPTQRLCSPVVPLYLTQ